MPSEYAEKVLDQISTVARRGIYVLSEDVQESHGGRQTDVEVKVVYPTRDGKTVAVSLLETRYWRKFCLAIGRPDLAPEHEHPSARLSSHGELTEGYRKGIADYCAAHDRDDIARAMAEQDIPVIPVLTPDEALQSRHVAERQLVRCVPHATEGKITELRNPLHSAGLVREQRTPAPEIGADNSEVLQRLGFSKIEIADLVNAGTI